MPWVRDSYHISIDKAHLNLLFPALYGLIVLLNLRAINNSAWAVSELPIQLTKSHATTSGQENIRLMPWPLFEKLWRSYTNLAHYHHPRG